jgi:hypothetical protein
MSDKAPAEQDFSDNLSIQRVLLETSASKPTIEISSTTTGIDIFEHLDKPYLTAALAYVDQEDIIGSLDISGGEKITIDLKSMQNNWTRVVSKTFFIDKIVSADKTSDNVEMFVFHLIEDIGYLSNLYNLNRSMSGKPSVIISNISKEFFSKDIKSSSTDFQSMKVIVPNLTPIEAMCWIKNRASTSDGYPFYLYSTLVDKELNFNDLRSMMKGIKINPDMPFTFSESASGNDEQPTIARNRTIMRHQSKNTNNIFGLIREGMVGSKYSYVDVTKNRVVDFDFNIDNEVVKLLRKDNIVDKGTPIFDSTRLDDTKGDITNRKITQVGGTNAYFTQKSYMESEGLAQYKLNIVNRSMAYMLTNNKIDVIVDGVEFLDGSANKTIGNKIDIRFLRNTNTEHKDSIYDRKKSGDFLIFACKHTISPRTYTLTLSAMKLSNGELL